MSAQGITIVAASAGSGKTFRLTEDVSRAVHPDANPRVPLEGLVALTYTRKAHAELAARIRRTLVKAGAFDEAMRLPLAYLGTVHAACLRWLQEFAIDAGLSPNVDVVAEDAGKLLRQALEAELSTDLRERLDRLAKSFLLRWQPMVKRHDWLGPVSDIMDLARGNRIAPDALRAMGARSATGLLALLPAPERDGDALDAALVVEIGRAVKTLRKSNDVIGTTVTALENLEQAADRAKAGQLSWDDWAKLARIAPSKRSAPLVDDLRSVAARYERHPRFHAELRGLTESIFEAARIGLSAYQDWKSRRRVVDYVDMLDRALDLLSHPRVADELGSRLHFLVVDEFQDTSPIQLALFMKLHALAGRSVWVGDRKQCIFEYAGADPLLMDAVAAWVKSSGGTPDILGRNYRSRPELVAACSELFASALARHGFVRDEVVVAPKRKALDGLAGLDPFGLWCLDTKNKDEDTEAIADGVRRMLAEPSLTKVLDRTTDDVRDVRPGDIAVLVATNAEARNLADALHLRGIRAALARTGLLGTPEGTLADSALRWLVDDRDSLAAAKIDALTGFGGRSPDAWLAAVTILEEGPEAPATGWRAALAPVRERLRVLSPSEAMDAAMAAVDAVGLAARWPDPSQRLANLDALRALAAAYEERCAQEREAATVAGLLRHFDDMQTEMLRRDEMIASDDQHVPSDEGAVVVCTYHKAKGLEWPVVVLGSLDREPRRDAFEVTPESDHEGFDPMSPLAGRWIRYWPWPHGQLTNVPLTAVAAQSPEGRHVTEREEKERARLLYVGFTRARDHLVLAVRVKANKTATKVEAKWLGALADAAGTPLLGLPTDAANGATEKIRIASGAGKTITVPVRVWRLNPTQPEQGDDARPAARWFARPAEGVGGAERKRYRIRPSFAREDWPEVVVPKMGELVRFASGMAVDGKVAAYDVLGDAVHAFLAADLPGLTPEERSACAERLVAAAGLTGIVRAEELVGAGDRLREFVDARWPGARWRREVPIEASVAGEGGERSIVGIIDLLLETADGVVLIDHKTFPAGAEAALRMKGDEYAPQFGAYIAALGACGARVIGAAVHFPVAGSVLAFECVGRP